MAIIYTYPKLTNPQGNELIVVSDVNNKNSTRLITIADIASLIPGGGGGGCSSAIAGILTGAGDYIPPLCNEVTFAGSGINISADQATATVTFTVPPSSITCATTNQIGGIKAYPTQTESGDWPQPSEEGTYYPLEAVTFLEAGPNATCMGAVKIPDSESYVLPCATNSTLGGIKAQTNTGVISVPDVSESGTYYPIELMKDPGVVTGADCTAIVKVPSVDLTCATATTLGGIKASKVTEIEVPEPANTGDYYPVQLTENQADDDCTAVVRIPTPTTPEDATLVATQTGGTNDDPNLTLTSGANVDNVKLVGGTGVNITRNSDVEVEISATASAISCATNSTIGGIIVGQGVIPSPVTPPEEGTVYPVQVTNECLAGVRIPNQTLPPDYLIKAVTHSTTLTTTTDPSRFPLPRLTAATTPFAQIKFTPSSVTGTNNDVFTVFKRPQNAEHYVKIVVKCTVLTADDDDISDERYFMGLHHSTTDVTGANLSYNYQVTGDYDLDDLISGDQLNQIQFTWYIQVGDLLNSAGSAASSGEDCYIYVKALYDSSSAVNAPSIILGRQWNVNPVTTQGTIEAAGPLEICAYEIQDTKYENNPTPPGTEEEGEEEGDKEG